MAMIEIVSWKEDYVGFTGWDDHARTEVTKRLRKAINASPNEIKSLARQIRARQPLWFMEGMAYFLSEDPRPKLSEPFEQYRSQFKDWYRLVSKERLWTEARSPRSSE